MYPVSASFLRALATPHQVVHRVDAYFNGTLTLADLPITGGAVKVDRGSKIRRQLTLELADPSFLPWRPADPLAVYGQTLVVSRGIQFPDGTREMCPLGTFRVDEPSGDVYSGPITVTGKSREVAIQDDRFTAPRSTSGATSTVSMITALITETIPGATIVNLTSGARDQACSTVVWDTQADRWEAVTQLATSMRAEIFVDVLDRFVLVDVPDLTTSSPVWTVGEGPTGTLITAGRKITRAGVYNAVVASGESAYSGVPPVSATVTDTDPASPTRWGGPYGRVPRFYSSGLLTSSAQCAAVATSMLRDALAPSVETSISCLPNPALEAGDCLRLSYAGGRVEDVLVQALTVPLSISADFAVTLRGSKEVPA
ncbi:DUF5047 domain-containing protein [Kitasatospora sp. NPDC101183]|uniref:DUF5047 domain-containing protein n=1 Tax=Kitasatospora sp. NPDC101183 TaxID=3364100 RepID=UPI00381F39F2